VDSGPIYLKSNMRFKGSELFILLKGIQALATIKLCCEFIENYPAVLIGAGRQQGKSSFTQKELHRIVNLTLPNPFENNSIYYGLPITLRTPRILKLMETSMNYG